MPVAPITVKRTDYNKGIDDGGSTRIVYEVYWVNISFLAFCGRMSRTLLFYQTLGAIVSSNS